LRYTRERIIGEIQRWVREHGRAPSYGDWVPAPPGLPSPSTVAKYFGGWERAIRAAGEEPVGRGYGAAPRRAIWSREKIVAALALWMRENGRAPSFHEWAPSPPGYPSRSTVVNYLGSWRNAIEAAEEASEVTSG
jgi:hypothetical protein